MNNELFTARLGGLAQNQVLQKSGEPTEVLISFAGYILKARRTLCGETMLPNAGCSTVSVLYQLSVAEVEILRKYLAERFLLLRSPAQFFQQTAHKQAALHPAHVSGFSQRGRT